MPPIETLHATTVAICGRGVLILGPSGSGKSDLALRLIDRGAVLVADDYTVVRALDDAVVASAPPTIAGRIEVRGVDIVEMAFAGDVPIALCVSLDGDGERLPSPRTRTVAGIVLPEMLLDPRPASAPIKVELMLAQVPAEVA